METADGPTASCADSSAADRVPDGVAINAAKIRADMRGHPDCASTSANLSTNLPSRSVIVGPLSARWPSPRHSIQHSRSSRTTCIIRIMANHVELQQITKSFGRTRALDGFDLAVRPGEVHGLLGPNGAGKSTTIRILLGMLHAQEGRARVLGQDPWMAAPEVRARLAYVPGDVSLWPNLTGGEIIDLLARMHGGEDRARRDALIERFQLDATKRSRTYSKGNRQKVGLISALSVTAELLILDEPTSGLDPLMEDVFKQCIKDARDEGRTVLLSSHILSEVEQLCDRVSIVRAGRVVDVGTLAELRGHGATVVNATLTRIPAGLEQLPGVENVSIDGHRVELTTTAFDDVMALFASCGIEVLIVAPPTLEDLFLHYYEQDGADRDRVGASA
ncbi:MAG: ATP-binding cassette domain-containing protein [Pseudoclavibacter sp.]